MALGSHKVLLVPNPNVHSKEQLRLNPASMRLSPPLLGLLQGGKGQGWLLLFFCYVVLLLMPPPPQLARQIFQSSRVEDGGRGSSCWGRTVSIGFTGLPGTDLAFLQEMCSWVYGRLSPVHPFLDVPAEHPLMRARQAPPVHPNSLSPALRPAFELH